MDKLFNNLDIQLNWDVLFGIFTFAGFLITCLIKFINNSKSDICLKYVSINNLIDKPNELSNDLKIILNGKEIEQLSKIEVVLGNSGNKCLNSDDFHIPPTINLFGFTNIINLNISCSNKYAIYNTKIIDLSKLEIYFNEFQSNDYFKIELFFESILNDYMPTYERKLKEGEIKIVKLNDFHMSKPLGIDNDYNTLAILVLVSGFATFFLTIFLIIYGLGIKIENLYNFPIGWKLLFCIPTAYALYYSFKKYNKVLSKYHYGFHKVNNWHSKTIKESLSKST